MTEEGRKGQGNLDRSNLNSSVNGLSYSVHFKNKDKKLTSHVSSSQGTYLIYISPVTPLI